MTLFFTRIPYAVTLTDGELVDENYSGHDPLVCEFCGVPMERIIGPDDSQHYQHVLHGQSAAIKPCTVSIDIIPLEGYSPTKH